MSSFVWFIFWRESVVLALVLILLAAKKFPIVVTYKPWEYVIRCIVTATIMLFAWRALHGGTP